MAKNKMTKKIVSEKTLELNVCAELLSLIRAMPGCRKAFWIGMKQQQEARNGIDELISNVPSGLHLALQFKSPKPPSPGRKSFEFTLNDRQHQHLVRLAVTRPSSVHYVLPHYNTFTLMRNDSPNLLDETYFLTVWDLQSLLPSVNQKGTHTVESHPPMATVRSDPIEVKLFSPSMGTLTPIVGEDSRMDSLLSHVQLRDWLFEMFRQEEGNLSAIGQRLRGFGTMCIP